MISQTEVPAATTSGDPSDTGRTRVYKTEVVDVIKGMCVSSQDFQVRQIVHTDTTCDKKMTNGTGLVLLFQSLFKLFMESLQGSDTSSAGSIDLSATDSL